MPHQTAAGAHRGAISSGGGGGGGGSGSRAAANSHSLPATVKYSFEGVKHVLAETTAAVTVVAFAALRNDLLAFGCADGELWVVSLPAAATAQAQPSCTKTRKMHGQALQAIDWAYDNSQLLSVGHDGSLCVWDAADPAFPCIRSISVHTTAFLCGRFHRVNFSLAMVGTSGGSLEVYNCSTGMLHSKYQVAAAGSRVQVTALDSSNHHVFLGDSAGVLHWYACELHGRQLSRLRPAGRLRLVAAGQPPAAVTALQYVPFCRTTDTPVLMAALQDGALCIVRANEARHTADLYLRRGIAAASGHNGGQPNASFSRGSSGSDALADAASRVSASTITRLCPTICPLSVIHDVPLITYGSDDTSVYIVDVTARSFSSAVPRGAVPGASGGATDRPMTVTVLKAHRAAVTAVAWSYDEALLASADADGIVVLWQRCRLF